MTLIDSLTFQGLSRRTSGRRPHLAGLVGTQPRHVTQLHRSAQVQDQPVVRMEAGGQL